MCMFFLWVQERDVPDGNRMLKIWLLSSFFAPPDTTTVHCGKTVKQFSTLGLKLCPFKRFNS